MRSITYDMIGKNSNNRRKTEFKLSAVIGDADDDEIKNQSSQARAINPLFSIPSLGLYLYDLTDGSEFNCPSVRKRPVVVEVGGSGFHMRSSFMIFTNYINSPI